MKDCPEGNEFRSPDDYFQRHIRLILKTVILLVPVSALTKKGLYILVSLF